MIKLWTIKFFINSLNHPFKTEYTKKITNTHFLIIKQSWNSIWKFKYSWINFSSILCIQQMKVIKKKNKTEKRKMKKKEFQLESCFTKKKSRIQLFDPYDHHHDGWIDGCDWKNMLMIIMVIIIIMYLYHLPIYLPNCNIHLIMIQKNPL